MSGLTTGDKLTATATDGSNNTSEFGPNYTVVFLYNVTGRVYTDEGVTALGAGRTVRLVINGSSAGTGVIDGSGNYSITAAYSAGQAVLVYIDNDEDYQGVTASVFPAASVANFNIYAGPRDHQAGQRRGLEQRQYGHGQGGYVDTDILYSVSGGRPDSERERERAVCPSGHSYTPGGNITAPALKSLGTFSGGSGTHDINGAMTIAGGSFTATSGTLSVEGDFTITGGSFTHNSGTIVFDGTSNATVNTGGFGLKQCDRGQGAGRSGPSPRVVQGSNLTVNGTLNVLSGMHNQVEAYSLTAGTISISAGAKLRNFGTGSLTLGAGGLANSGTVDLNGGGDTSCGSATEIQILSTVNGTQRSWTGSGTFNLVDLNVKDQAGTATLTAYGSTNSGNNGANWTINGGCVGAPTAVRLRDFRAAVYREGVQVTWRTGYEAENLGFHLYREEDGKLIRLTPELIAGSALFAGTTLNAGRSYSWWDDAERRTPNAERTYWLEDLDLNGKRTRHGPITATVAEGSLSGKAHSAFISRLGLMKQQSQPGDQRSTGDKSRTASRPGKPVDVPSNLQPPTVQRVLAGGPAIKVEVREEGWVRIGRDELLAAGMSTLADPRNLQLYEEGRELPLQVKGDLEYVAFYGRGLDTPATDRRVYWLVSGTRPGKRLLVVNGTWDPTRRSKNSGSPVPPKRKNSPDHFFCPVEAKPRLIYFPGLKNGEAENFFGPLISTVPAVQTLEVRDPHPTSSDNAVLEVTLQGVNAGTHLVNISLNGTGVGQVVFDNQNQGQAHLSVSPALLVEGKNEVAFTAAGGAEDYSLIDRVRLTYLRSYRAHNDFLRFTAYGGLNVALSGFSREGVRVMDITEAGAYYEVQGRPTGSGTDHGVTFTVPGSGHRTFLAFTEEARKTAAAVYPNQPSNWHQGLRGRPGNDQPRRVAEQPPAPQGLPGRPGLCGRP